jgi:hypothetical protein
MSRFRLIVDGFHGKGARDLRAVFVNRFANPRSTRADRFVWDYWHVPDQYTAVRTPAWEYFPKKVYDPFHRALVDWGRRTLGCWDVSPPWLSYYVDGCEQLLHSDVPHGPWAFVYALTPPGRPRFTGGETLVVRPSVLTYWKGFVDTHDRELESFVERIPSRFDRLVVFDPRFPHGVTRVEGTKDPREARLVVHGWFTEPRPFFEGGHPARAVDRALEEGVGEAARAAAGLGAFHGMLSVRLSVDRAGRVKKASVLANTLVSLDEPGASAETSVVRAMVGALKKTTFGTAKGTTEVTLPLLFR